MRHMDYRQTPYQESLNGDDIYFWLENHRGKLLPNFVSNSEARSVIQRTVPSILRLNFRGTIWAILTCNIQRMSIADWRSVV